MIYLDNAATTYPKPECVYEALDRANRTLAFNAGRGSYKEAKIVSDMIDETRKQIADLAKTSSDHVFFESSATEALNIIINGLDLNKGDAVYVSPFEHNAVIRPLYHLKQTKEIEILELPFDKNTWTIDLDKMKDMFVINKPKACFLTQISNVTGFVLPLGVIFAQTRQYNCVNVADCSQGFGIFPSEYTCTDFIVFAGHKSLYASFGVAGFVNLTGVDLLISKSGGTGSDSLNTEMPKDGHSRFEAGSINSVAIAGLHSSLKWLKENDVLIHEKTLTDYLLKKLKHTKNIKAFLPVEGTVFGIVSIAVDGYDSNDVGTILSEDYGISVRTGYHCAPFVHDFIGSKDYGGTVRISIGFFNSTEDVDKLISALEELTND